MCKYSCSGKNDRNPQTFDEDTDEDDVNEENEKKQHYPLSGSGVVHLRGVIQFI